MSGRGFMVMDPSPLKEERCVLKPVNTAYFEVSPSHKPAKEKVVEEEVSVLRLIHFTHCPKIDFGKVKLGNEQKRILRILNPKDITQDVVCEKLPSDESGFAVSLTTATLAPAETCDVEIWWRPTKEGATRETLQWRSNAGVRAQTVIFGSCFEPILKKKKVRPGTRVPLQGQNVALGKPKAGVKSDSAAAASRPGKAASKGEMNKENSTPGKRVTKARPLKQGGGQQQNKFVLTVQPQAFRFSENTRGAPSLSRGAGETYGRRDPSCDRQTSRGLRESLGYFDTVETERITTTHNSEVHEVQEEYRVENSESFHAEEVLYARDYDGINAEISSIEAKRFESSRSEHKYEEFQNMRETVSVKSRSVRHGKAVEDVLEANPVEKINLSSFLKKGGHKKHVMWEDAYGSPEVISESINKETYEYTEECVETCETIAEQETYFTEGQSFRKILAGRLPECTVASSPARRQTFVKEDEIYLNDSSPLMSGVNEVNFGVNATSDEVFISAKTQTITPLMSDSPARRETYSAETFNSIDEDKNLPPCDVESSPLRRETYVKDYSDSLRRATLSVVHERPPNIPRRMPPFFLKDEVHGRGSVVTAAAPTPVCTKKVSPSGLSAITASCMNLLNQLEIDSPNSTVTNVSLDRNSGDLSDEENEPDTSLKVSSGKNILRKDNPKGQNDLSESVVTPVRNFQLHSPLVGRSARPLTSGSEACPVLYVSPAAVPVLSKISETGSRDQSPELNQHVASASCNLNASSRIESSTAPQSCSRLNFYPSSEAMQKDCLDVPENELQCGSLTNTSSQQSEIFSDSLENKIDSLNSNFDVNSSKKSHATVVGFRNSSLSPCDNLVDLEDHLRRLSTDTVTKETSILLPEEIVNLDEEAVVDPNICKNIQDPHTHESNRPAFEGFIRPWADEQASIDGPCHSKLGDLPDFAASRAPIVSYYDQSKEPHPKPNPEAFGMSEQTFMCSSLSEFSFYPGNDPRRCSTGVKPTTPADVINSRCIEGGLRLFMESTVDDGEKQQDTAAKVAAASFATLASPLTTIVETEEKKRLSGGSALVQAKNSTFDKSQPSVNTQVHVAPISDEVMEAKETQGLQLIEISPPNKRPAESPAAKQPGWSKAKRTRYEPRSGVRVAVQALKLAGERRPPPGKAVVVSSKCKSPIAAGTHSKSTSKPPGTLRAAIGNQARIEAKNSRSLQKSASASSVLVDRMLSCSTITPATSKNASKSSLKSKVSNSKESLVRCQSKETLFESQPKKSLIKSRSKEYLTQSKEPLIMSQSKEFLFKAPSRETLVKHPLKEPLIKTRSGESSSDTSRKDFPCTNPVESNARSIGKPFHRRSLAVPQPTRKSTVADVGKYLKRGNSNLNLRALKGSSTNITSSMCDSTALSSSTASSSEGNHSKGSIRGGLKKTLSLRSIPVKVSSRSMNIATFAHHPNPFVADNMFYDNKWVEKQTAGFTRWLNFVLTPPEEENTAAASGKVEIKGLWAAALKGGFEQEHRAPTKEVLSLKTYTAHGRLNRLRRAACRLYQQPSIAQVIAKLEVAIDKKLIVMRKDRQIHMDVGLKQQLLQLLLCYNPLWLRLGLETVFGELLLLQSNADVTAITRYIIFRLLSNPELQRRYAHPSVPHCYRPGYEEAVQMYLNKKFLVLVLFLDSAKTNKLIDHDPCLFRKDAPFKSSRELLLEYARDFLSGVGDLTKHLGYLGYNVQHQQTSLDEFDYAVSNLATDLRCGIRLVRVSEILTRTTVGSLSSKLRMPAVSRLQKVHNMTLALQQLQGTQKAGEEELCVRFPASDVVAGHRECTLGLLWALISSSQLLTVVSVHRLREEVQYLQRSLSVRAHMDPTASSGSKQLLALLAEERASNDCVKATEEGDSPDTLMLLLKRWVQFICAHYGLTVYNMTASLSDGRALCQVLHHYHPDLLPLHLVNDITTHTVQLQQGVDLDVSTDDSFSNLACADEDSQQERQQRLVNEKANHAVFADKLCSLGGVPLLVRPSELVNTMPDEKVMTTFVAYLCGRLLDLSEEIKAARVLQMAWRRRALRKQQEQLRIATAACVTIQRWWHRVLRRLRYASYCRAAVVLQKHWRRVAAQRLRRQLKQRKLLQKQNYAALVIQSSWRRYVVLRYVAKYKATLHIQSVWRTYKQRRLFLKCRESALKIQTAFRGHQARKAYCTKINAIIKIQSFVKMGLARRKFVLVRNAALLIQSHWRRLSKTREIRSNYLQLRSVCVIIQTAVRGMLQRRKYLRVKAAVIIIQSSFRAMKQRRSYLEFRSAAVSIQKLWRRILVKRAARRDFLNQKKSAIVLQTAWRSYSLRRRFLCYRSAATTIASYWRMYCTRTYYQRLRKATVTVQLWAKRSIETHKKRNEYLVLKSASIKLQCYWRMRDQRQKYLKLRYAALVFQKNWRVLKARRNFVALKTAAILVQRRFRSNILMRRQREAYVLMRSSVIVIQKTFRGYLEKKRYATTVHSAVLIQAVFRGYLARRAWKKMMGSVRVLQVRTRAWLYGRQERSQFLALKTSAIIIQKSWRSFVCRKQFLLLKHSSVVLQKTWRMRAQRTKYLITLNAATAIQKYFRGYLITKSLSRHFNDQKRACLVIQTHFRRFSYRRKFVLLKQAALSLQNHFRARRLGNLARRDYLHYRWSVTKVQACVRRFLAQRRYQRMVFAVTVIQSRRRALLEMRKAKDTYQSTVKSIILVQSLVRMRHDRMNFMEQKNAASMLQAALRAWIAGKAERKAFLNLKHSVLVIQKYYRGYQCRKLLTVQQQAATTIQSYWRMTFERRRYLKTRNCIVSMQRCYRRSMLMNHARHQFLAQKSACIKLQCYWRMVKCRQQFLKKRMACIIIQRRWRATLKTKAAVAEYLKTVGAVVTIQSWVKMIVVSRRYTAQHAAATILQRKYRSQLAMRQARNNFKVMRSSAIIIQSAWRSYISRKRYCLMRINAIKIAAAYRSYSARKHYCLLRFSAVKIQATWRSYVARKNYRTIRASVVKIQEYVRAVLLGLKERKKFIKIKLAAVTIQKFYRGSLCRRDLTLKRNAALLIQKNVRMMLTKKLFLSYRSAAVTIQRAFRGLLLMRSCRQTFLRLRCACVSIQNQRRMVICRNKYLLKRNACITVQKNFRMMRDFNAYQKKRKAALTIQNWFRNLKFCQATKSDFIAKKRAALCLQSLWKMYVCKRLYNLQKQAVTVIQTRYRELLLTRQVRQQFLLKKAATVVIQTRYRELLLARQIRQQFLLKKAAAVVIQTRYRELLLARQIRQQFLLKKAAAVVIQSHVRCFMATKKYQKLRCCTTIIQRHFRAQCSMQLARSHYRLVKQSVVTLQCCFRMLQARNRFERLRQAVVVVQRRWRACVLQRRERNRFLKKRNSAIRIQAQVRSYLDRQRYLSTLDATVKIQRWYRGTQLTRSARLEFDAKRCAAITLQAACRGWKVRVNFKKLQLAVLTLQIAWRRSCAARKCLVTLQACVKIQRWYRACVEARRCLSTYVAQKSAAVIVQSWVRCVLQRRRFMRLRAATVMLQSVWRMRKCRAEFERYRGSALCIQTHYRNYKIMGEVQKRFLAMKTKATIIQSWYRGVLVRRQIQRLHAAAVIVQKHYRRVLQTRNYKMLKSSVALAREETLRNSSAVVIQKHVRAFVCRRAYQRCLKSTIVLQSVARCLIMRKRFLAYKNGVMMVQKRLRATQCTRQQRSYYLSMKNAAVVIQRRYRATLLMRQQKYSYVALKNAAVVIQAAWRSLCVRRAYVEMRKKRVSAALVIQRHYRCWREQRRVYAVVTLQRYWRGAITSLRLREQFIYMRRAAVILQTAWRARAARQLIKREKAARTIQRYYRKTLERRRAVQVVAARLADAAEQQQARTVAALKIQHWWRLKAVLCTGRVHLPKVLLLQRWWRRVLQSRRAHVDRMRAARLIQARWRGHRVRNIPVGTRISALRLEAPQQRRLTLVRKRLDEANTRAQDQKCIGQRTKCAIMYLFKYRDLKRILQAVIALEASTRWSAVCCCSVVEEGTLTHLLRLVNDCNRSLPYVQILTYVLNIFLNLVKCDQTFDSVAQVPDIAEVLVQLMSIYHEKNPLLFSKSCSLLYLLSSHKEERKMKISDAIKTDTAKICSIMLRKASARERGRKFVTPGVIAPHRCPAHVPCYALTTNFHYEFEEALSAALTLLKHWGVKV
ncbi:IQ motif EF-hand binding site [Trinorchestia longiramus]|nr:IQ motif EF-hand binding site [Trinorchestia longiramus]